MPCHTHQLNFPARFHRTEDPLCCIHAITENEHSRRFFYHPLPRKIAQGRRPSLALMVLLGDIAHRTPLLWDITPPVHSPCPNSPSLFLSWGFYNDFQTPSVPTLPQPSSWSTPCSGQLSQALALAEVCQLLKAPIGPLIPLDDRLEGAQRRNGRRKIQISPFL